MRAELLSVGTELVSGSIVNTNATYLARQLATVGIACGRHVAIVDERSALLGALREALARAELLVITGGLGPTFDDITMEAISQAVGRRLVPSLKAARAIHRFYSRSHRRLRPHALRQAELPEGGLPLPNPVGTAPGLWLWIGPRLMIALPGVPAEMRAIMERTVLPRLRRLATGAAIAHRLIRTVGLVELDIEARLKALRVPETVQVGLYPHLRTVDVSLTTSAPSQRKAGNRLRRIEDGLRRALGEAVYGAGDETLEQVVSRLLIQRVVMLGVAESCTGGLLSDRLTNVPGSSRYFRGSLVAYDNRVKQSCLGVPKVVLQRFGAVSARTALAMAAGARRLLEADIGLAITGIAGPGGGTPRKPVGLVYLALVGHADTRLEEHRFFGDRLAVKGQASQAAMDCLRRYLLAHPRPGGDSGGDR